jgi:hypothetical protein
LGLFHQSQRLQALSSHARLWMLVTRAVLKQQQGATSD